MLIRPATAADLSAIGRLAAMLVALHHELDPQRFIAPTPGTPKGYAAFLGTQLEERDAFVLVAEDDGEIVGYSYAGVEGADWMALRGPAGVVHDIVIDPSQRRRGAGRMLLEATIAELERRGAPRVVLWTAALNTNAQELFTGAGFRHTMIEMTRELRGNRGAGRAPE